jgi:hypothetical protein
MADLPSYKYRAALEATWHSDLELAIIQSSNIDLPISELSQGNLLRPTCPIWVAASSQVELDT